MDGEKKHTFQNDFEAIEEQNQEHSFAVSYGKELDDETIDGFVEITHGHASDSLIPNVPVERTHGHTSETPKQNEHVETLEDKTLESIRRNEQVGSQHGAQKMASTINSITERIPEPGLTAVSGARKTAVIETQDASVINDRYNLEEVNREIHSLRDLSLKFTCFCEQTEGWITTLFSLLLKDKERGNMEKNINKLKEHVRNYRHRCVFERGRACGHKEAVKNGIKECTGGSKIARRSGEELNEELERLMQLTDNKFKEYEYFSRKLEDIDSKTPNRIYIDMLKEDIAVVKEEINEFRQYCDNKDSKIKTRLQDIFTQGTESGSTDERLEKTDSAMKMLTKMSKSYFRQCCAVKGKILILENHCERAKAHSITGECSEVVMALEKELCNLKDLHKDKFEELENNEKGITKKEFRKLKSEQEFILRKQLKKTEALLDDYAKMFDDEQLKVKQLEAEIKEKNDGLHDMAKKDIRNQEEKQQLEQDKSLLIEQYADLQGENNQLREDIKTLQKEHHHLNRLGDDNKILNGKIMTLNQNLQAVESTSNKHWQDLQAQKSHTDHWYIQFQQKLLNVQECTRHLEKSREDCRKLEQEKNSLVLRLSKIAGDNLTYKNPNIADLGDPKRPTKLAEVYNELYDNEWTDAFDNLGDLADTEKVQRMLTIMKSADDHCGELYKKHTDAVKNGLTTLSIKYKTKVKVDTDVQRGEEDKNETTIQTIHPNTNTDATREERDVLGDGANNDTEDTNDQTKPKGTYNGNNESDKKKSVEKKAKDTTDEEMQERQMDGIEEYGNPKDGAVSNDGKSYEQHNQEQNSVMDARENPAPLTQHDGAVKGDGQSADNQSQNSGMNVHSNPDPLTQQIDYEEKTEEIPFEFDDLNNTQKQAIAEIGRFVQNALEEKVVEATSKVIVEEMELPKVSGILSYVRKCVTFCWSARLHNPPVYIDFMEVTEDTLLDLNVYKPYTMTGKLVDYVVWPPIYLHKGGPMLSKGVAQGKNKN